MTRESKLYKTNKLKNELSIAMMDRDNIIMNDSYSLPRVLPPLLKRIGIIKEELTLLGVY